MHLFLHPHLDAQQAFAGENILSVIASSADKTHSVHATSRSLFSLLSVPSFKGFHLSVLLSQHRLCRRWPWVTHSDLRGHSLWSRWLKWRMARMGWMRLIRNPLHWARSCAGVGWKLLGAGSTRSPGHPTSHTTRHSTGNSPWHITLHTWGDRSRYTTRNIPDWRTTGCSWQNLLSGFLSSDVYRRKVGGLEGVRADRLVIPRVHGCRFV